MVEHVQTLEIAVQGVRDDMRDMRSDMSTFQDTIQELQAEIGLMRIAARQGAVLHLRGDGPGAADS